MRRNVLVLMLAAAVGILAGGPHPVEADSFLRERVVENPDPGQPDYVLAGQNASLQYWKNADGAVSQALYRSADDTVSVRTFYDETTGLPRKVSDELSGNWLLIQENGADSVDFWSYDLLGSYQHGVAVFEDAEQYHVGDIAGLPIHAGKQITGELVPAASSWTGSFTLDIDTGDLKTRKPVAADIAALMDDLAPDGTLLSALTLGGMILLGLVGDASGDAVAPADTAAFDARVAGKVVVFTYTDSGHMARVEFLPAGHFVWTDQNDSQPGNFSYLNTGPDTGTITLTFDPDNDPDEYAHVFEVTFTSGSSGVYESTHTEGGQEPVVASGRFKIVDWVAPDGIATAGVAALVTSLFVPDVAAGNRDKCARLGNAVSRDVCRLAADFLAHGVESGPTGLVRDGVDWARDKPGHLADRIDRGKEALENVAGELLPDDAIQERQDTEPLALETPPPIGSRVSGEASGPGGTVAQVEGDVTPDGDFAVAGDDDGDLSVVIRGSVGDGDTADLGDVAPTLNRTGASSLRAAMGGVGLAEPPANPAAFEWGTDNGKVRSVRSAAVLQGDAPVVVRKIRFVQTPEDGRAVTLDLSDYVADPNGDPMHFTAVSDSQYLDVRVSGSTLSIRQLVPDRSLVTRIRVTATDPGGLTADMTFAAKTFAPPAILWTYHDPSDAPVIEEIPCGPGGGFGCQSSFLPRCWEYVILNPRHPVDLSHPHYHDGLTCPDSYLSNGGCHEIFDWGVRTGFRHVIPINWWAEPSQGHAESHQEARRQEREACLRRGFRWSTEHFVPPKKRKNLIQLLKHYIRSSPVPGRPGSRSRSTATGVRG